MYSPWNVMINILETCFLSPWASQVLIMWLCKHAPYTNTQTHTYNHAHTFLYLLRYLLWFHHKQLSHSSVNLHADFAVLLLILLSDRHFLCPHFNKVTTGRPGPVVLCVVKCVCVFKQDLRPTFTALDSLLCGAFAGAVAKTVIAPLDRTKIIFQGKNGSLQN